MNREDIIRMAQEAGWKDLRNYDFAMNEFLVMGDFKDLERFAALVAAANQPAQQQEPVAWSYWQSCLNDDGTQTAPWVHRLSKFQPSESIINKDIVPLYTTPPQSTWVGLILKDMPDKYMGNKTFIAGAKWAAKQLKASNVPKD